MSLVEGIKDSFSAWFGGDKDVETKEQSALGQYAQERFKVIDTNMQKGSLGHKLDTAKVVILLGDRNSLLSNMHSLREFGVKQTKSISFSDGCRNFHKAPQKINISIVEDMGKLLLSTAYARTEEELRQGDHRIVLFQKLIDELNQPDRLEMFRLEMIKNGLTDVYEIIKEFAQFARTNPSEHTREQRFVYLQRCLMALTLIFLQADAEKAKSDEVTQIEKQTKTILNEVNEALQKKKRLFVITSEANGRFVNSDAKAISAVENLYKQFQEKNIPYITLKLRKELNAPPSQRETDGLNLNDVSYTEQKLKKRAEKLEKQNQAVIQEFDKSKISDQWALFNQWIALDELAQKHPNTATLKYIANSMASWKLPELENDQKQYRSEAFQNGPYWQHEHYYKKHLPWKA